MKPIHFVYIFFVACSLGACQKVINVDLNSSAPRYVVEGNIVNSLGAQFVSITRSVNFAQDNTFPAVSGALVIVTDTTAQIKDTLKETTAGKYATSKILGTPGHTYSLYIKTDSNVFTSICTMPPFIKLDSLYDTKSTFRSSYSIVPVYTDPVTIGNYYQFVAYINGNPSDGIYVTNDNLINGRSVSLALNSRGPDNSKINAGDDVTIHFYCIDSATYQYFYTLQQTKNQNSATPANPITNIKGGALGYFSAHTEDVRSITVQ